MIKSLIISLFLTLLIEIVVSIILGVRDKNDFKIIICANICTNPIVVYISNLVLLLNNNLVYIVTVAALEIIAILVEYYIYEKRLSFKKVSPLMISLICNIVSFGIGVLLFFI